MNEPELRRKLVPGDDLDEEQAKARAQCTLALVSWMPFHRLAPNVVAGGVQIVYNGFSIGIKHAALSSYDPDGLTRLMLVAHRHSVRVTIEPRSAYSLELIFHYRDPEKGIEQKWAVHPTLDQLATLAKEF